MKVIRILISPILLIILTIFGCFGVLLTLIHLFFDYHASYDRLIDREVDFLWYMNEATQCMILPWSMTIRFITTGKIYEE